MVERIRDLRPEGQLPPVYLRNLRTEIDAGELESDETALAVCAEGVLAEIRRGDDTTHESPREGR